MEINTVGKLPFLRENIFYNRIRKSYRQSDVRLFIPFVLHFAI